MATIWESKLPFELQGDGRQKTKYGYESVIWEKCKKGVETSVGKIIEYWTCLVWLLTLGSVRTDTEVFTFDDTLEDRNEAKGGGVGKPNDVPFTIKLPR